LRTALVKPAMNSAANAHTSTDVLDQQLLHRGQVLVRVTVLRR
jgi:hypothetical protein